MEKIIEHLTQFITEQQRTYSRLIEKLEEKYSTDVENLRRELADVKCQVQSIRDKDNNVDLHVNHGNGRLEWLKMPLKHFSASGRHAGHQWSQFIYKFEKQCDIIGVPSSKQVDVIPTYLDDIALDCYRNVTSSFKSETSITMNELKEAMLEKLELIDPSSSKWTEMRHTTQ